MVNFDQYSKAYNFILTQRSRDKPRRSEAGNLTDAEVRSAVERNPELSTEERQKLLDHMNTIILASNRRVDIVLSNTGQKPQESVREYPFNATDSLALLDTEKTSKSTNHSAKKRRITKKCKRTSKHMVDGCRGVMRLG